VPPKRSAEKWQWVDESLYMDSNLQTTGDPALRISPALNETLVSRVVDEVTRCLQPKEYGTVAWPQL